MAYYVLDKIAKERSWNK